MTPKYCKNCGRAYLTDEDFLKGTTRWRVCDAGNLWFNCSCDSTLVLTASNYRTATWLAKTQTFSPEAASLFEKIQRIRALPHIPAVVMELQQQLENPDISGKDLAKTVRADPVIAAQVLAVFDKLRLVRQKEQSIYQNRPQILNHNQKNKERKFGETQKDSLEYAITFIGRKQLGNLVMVAYFEKLELKTSGFRIESYWDHMRQVAAIAEWLCRPLNFADRDQAYLSGYLADIGKLIGALIFPEKTDRVVARLNDPSTQTTWSDAERLEGLPGHNSLGEIAVVFWGLPGFLYNPVRYHHISRAEEMHGYHDGLKLVCLVSLAVIIRYWINLDPHRIRTAELEFCLTYFGLNEDKLKEMAEDIRSDLKLP